MKSGLEGRNNAGRHRLRGAVVRHVSMKSGLEGRNNVCGQPVDKTLTTVSMKSGLEGRNNREACLLTPADLAASQ